MKPLQRQILEQLIAGSSEPLLVARIDHPDWPVVLCNSAFVEIAGSDDVLSRAFADVVEEMVGRECALEVSEFVRLEQEITLPVTVGGHEYLLAVKPLERSSDALERYCVAYWLGSSALRSSAGAGEAQRALLRARRRIRDLTRDDPVTGLSNAKTFDEVLAHDWAVAAREKTRLAIVAFELQDFDKYQAVFGQHAADSCLHRVAQSIRRCQRRASDVAARVSGTQGDRLVVLSHAADEDGVAAFANTIVTAVRELGLHHPRSSTGKFVTVSYTITVEDVAHSNMSAQDFLDSVL